MHMVDRAVSLLIKTYSKLNLKLKNKAVPLFVFYLFIEVILTTNFYTLTRIILYDSLFFNILDLTTTPPSYFAAGQQSFPGIHGFGM